MNNTMCHGVDTGFDTDPTSGVMIVHCDMGAAEMTVLAHYAAQVGVSLREAESAMILLTRTFEEERVSLKDLWAELERTMLDLRMEDIEEKIYEQKDRPRTRVRLSVHQTRVRLSVPRPRVRLFRPDSRSGMKGKTIRRRQGKL